MDPNLRWGMESCRDGLHQIFKPPNIHRLMNYERCKLISLSPFFSVSSVLELQSGEVPWFSDLKCMQTRSVKCLNYSSRAEFMQQFVRIVGNGEILNVGEEKYWGIFGEILIKVDGARGRGIWRLDWLGSPFMELPHCPNIWHTRSKATG